MVLMKRGVRLKNKYIIIGITIFFISLSVITSRVRPEITFVEKGVGIIVVPIQKGLTNIENWFSDKVDDINNLPLFGSTGDTYRLALPYRNVYGKITGFIKRATPGAVKFKADKDGNPVEERYDSTSGLKKDDIFNIAYPKPCF